MEKSTLKDPQSKKGVRDFRELPEYQTDVKYSICLRATNKFTTPRYSHVTDKFERERVGCRAFLLRDA